MARSRLSLIYIGVKSFVVALDRKTGGEVWRTQLPAKYRSSSMFVNIFRDDEGLFASCAGEIFSLDPRTGELLWGNELKKLGTGLVAIASDLGSGGAATALAVAQAQAQAAAATSAAAV